MRKVWNGLRFFEVTDEEAAAGVEANTLQILGDGSPLKYRTEFASARPHRKRGRKKGYKTTVVEAEK